MAFVCVNPKTLPYKGPRCNHILFKLFSHRKKHMPFVCVNPINPMQEQEQEQA